MRVLVVGLGNQGRKRARVAGAGLVGSVDPVAPEATWRTLAEVPADAFQAALVCTPDDTKLELLRTLLDQGKHVLVEKPLLAGAAELLELSRRRGVSCYTAYNHRFEPLLVKLRELLPELGPIYTGRFFYGNGTARDVRDSVWRDQGAGVVTDLGSHLLDMWRYLFPQALLKLELWGAQRLENHTPDHFLALSRGTPVWQFEGSLLSWRNHFSLDLVGELGSLSLDGLCKWGPSCLTWRRRQLPSGKPDEERWVLEQPDPTWDLEFAHFLELAARSESNLENDIWLESMFADLMP